MTDLTFLVTEILRLFDGLSIIWLQTIEEEPNMLSIICNLKFCYKFFQEENFASLSDSQFERFEQSLESTEKMIERQRKAIMLTLLSHPSDSSPNLHKAMDCLEKLSHLVSQFWSQELETNFLDQLEDATLTLSLG